MLEIRNLNVEFSGKLAVRDTSFAVQPGESFGLVGESGSGKSTILRTVMGLNATWSGNIAVDGVDVRKTPRKQLAKGRIHLLEMRARFGAGVAVAVGERVRDRIEAHPFLAGDGLSLRLTASVGIATLPDVATSAEELVRAADMAMYQVKNSGKNGVQVALPPPGEG